MSKTRLKKSRNSPAWEKLIADGKLMHVYASTKVPARIIKMGKLAGIELLPATREERKPFLPSKTGVAFHPKAGG